MRIQAIHAREIALRLLSPFETSFGVTHQRRILLLEVETDEGTGWGECTAGEGPFYNPETTDTAWLMLKKFLAPLVLGKEFDAPAELNTLMGPVRGHEMAKATLETAAWDAYAKSLQVSLSSLLGGTQKEIACGVSLGIQKDVGKLLERIAREVQDGYQRVKLKIKPGQDVKTVAEVRRHYPDLTLTVDANSAYSLSEIELLKQLDAFDLTYIEQPLEWNEIYQHAELQRQLKTPVCLDECIHNLRDEENALTLGACGVINLKLGRVGGHAEAKKMQAYALARNIPVWSGGMLEAGIGRAHNVAMSSLPGFVFPGDVSASRRYWERDIIVPGVETTSYGTIVVPNGPGIGYEVDVEYIKALTVREEVWRGE